MNSSFFRNLIKTGIKAVTAIGALAAAALILNSDNSENKDQAKPQPEKPTEPQTPNASASQNTQAPDKATSPNSEDKSGNTSLAFPDEFYPKPEDIYVPDHRKAGKGDVPYVDLTEKEAVAQGWAFRKKSKTVRITNYHGTARDVVIPSRIGGRRVNEIGKFAFRWSKIDRVQIPGCVVKIGEFAFVCSDVREVIFGSRENGLRVIPEETFHSCRELKRMILPDTLVEIGRDAFSFCGSLEYIALPDSVVRIQEDAFYYSGLCGLSTKHPERLNDGSVFKDTALQKKYKIIATQNTESELVILSVAEDAKIKLPKKHVKFGHNSVCCRCSLDFSECTELDFKNDDDDASYNLPSTEIVVRHGQEGYFFGKKASVSYTDGEPYTKLLQPVEQDGDTLTVRYTGKFPHYNRIPAWYTEGLSVKSLKIISETTFEICSNAFCDTKLERLNIDCFFWTEGRILGYHFPKFREMRWKGCFAGETVQYIQYIPPEELIKDLHDDLMKAFSNPKYFFFDRSVFERAFKRKFFRSRSHRPPKAIESQIHERHFIPIAIDILRSTPYQFPDGTKLYSDYLRRHLTYARKFCEKIRPKYPEYAEFLENFK